MDSITHITLGACVGEIILGKKLGKKALIWGALSQSLPDIDTFAALFLPADQDLLIHRGITHSFVFAIAIGLLLAWAAKKMHHKNKLSFALLIFFFCFQLALHDLLDTCNSYGTGLLEPFSHHRFSINLLFVADPFFTISLIIASLVLAFKSSANRNRIKWAVAAIFISILYMGFAGFNKIYIDKRVEASFRDQKIIQTGYFSTPAPFNCMLWYVVAAADSSYFTGYSSVWDNAKQNIPFEMHLKNYALLQKTAGQNAAGDLITFADGYYTISQSGKIIYLNVLRFEQIQGWRVHNAGFVMSYPLSGGNNLSTLLQRRRLAGWDKNAVSAYIKRIAGRRYK